MTGKAHPHGSSQIDGNNPFEDFDPVLVPSAQNPCRIDKRIQSVKSGDAIGNLRLVGYVEDHSL